MRYIVMCQVSGGLTGTNRGPLKDQEHRVKYFNTQDEANSEAARLNEWARAGTYRHAEFKYWAEEA